MALPVEIPTASIAVAEYSRVATAPPQLASIGHMQPNSDSTQAVFDEFALPDQQPNLVFNQDGGDESME